MTMIGKMGSTVVLRQGNKPSWRFLREIMMGKKRSQQRPAARETTTLPTLKRETVIVPGLSSVPSASQLTIVT
jgi:hypothetical protein